MIVRKTAKLGIILGLLFCLCLCSHIGDARADSIPPVPANRMRLTTPQGMKATFTPTAGQFIVQIDDEQTDWGKALLYSGSNTDVMIFLDIIPPTGAEKYILYVGNDNSSDTEVLHFFSIREGGNEYRDLFQWTAAEFVAEFIPSHNTVSPYSFDDMDYFVRWYDHANQPLVTEKMRAKVRHTAPGSFYAALPLVSQADIMTNTDNVPYLSAAKSNGLVTYTITNALAAQNASNVVTTKVKAPAGATECVRIWNWGNTQAYPIQNGYAEIPFPYKKPELLTGIQQQVCSLEWRDASNAVVDCTMMELRLHTLETQPWPYYIAGWNPVPQNRLQMDGKAANAGVSTTYQSGILHHGYTHVIPDATQMDLADIRITLTPPQGATGYKLNVSSGLSSFGNQPDEKAMYDMMMRDWFEMQVIQAGSIQASEYPLFRKVETDKDVTVYLSTTSPEPEKGGLYVIYWYHDINDTEPMAVEYFFETADFFAKVVEMPAVANEEAVPDAISEPVVVGKPNWKLVIEHHPQIGNNARHYELRLEDENGDIVILKNQSVVIYLPYPKGLSHNSVNATYALRHYDLEFENFGNVNIKPTEKGLRFATTSLSPFVISWAARGTIPPTPKTGDDFPAEILTCAMALLLVTASIVVYRQKKRSV